MNCIENGQCRRSTDDLRQNLFKLRHQLVGLDDNGGSLKAKANSCSSTPSPSGERIGESERLKSPPSSSTSRSSTRTAAGDGEELVPISSQDFVAERASEQESQKVRFKLLKHNNNSSADIIFKLFSRGKYVTKIVS